MHAARRTTKRAERILYEGDVKEPPPVVTHLCLIEYYTSDLPKWLWGRWELQRLELREFPELKSVPNRFDALSALTNLKFEKCGLQKLPESIGALTRLVALHLVSCRELEKLPDIKTLTALCDLVLSGCSNLKALPDLHTLTALENLVLTGCRALQKLPNVGTLTALCNLNLSWCILLQQLPHELENLKTLKTLQMESCSALKTMRSLFGLGRGGLDKLMCLDMSNGDFSQLPPSLVRLTSLHKLVLSSCKNLYLLPEDIHKLARLWVLHLNLCKRLKALPESIGMLTTLTELQLSSCPKLSSIPSSLTVLCGLSTFRTLDIHNSGVESVPESAEFGRKLMCVNESTWNLENMPKLKILGPLPPTTTVQKLDIWNCSALQRIPESIGGLQGLTSLHMSYCESMKELPQALGVLLELRDVDLTALGLQTLPDSIGKLAALTSLRVQECQNLHSLPESLGALTQLVELHFPENPTLRGLPLSWNRLASLRRLNLRFCPSLVQLPLWPGNALTQLTHLFLDDCQALQFLWNVERQVKARMLVLRGQSKIPKEIVQKIGEMLADSFAGSPFEHMTALRTLSLYNCAQLELPDLSALTQLRILRAQPPQ